jgi:hypothetical protein
MIDTSIIAGSINHKVTDADIVDYYEVPNLSEQTQKPVGTWLEMKPITPLDEGMSSSETETGVYILDYVVYVPIGTSDTILDEAQLELGNLLNPLTNENALFVDTTLNAEFYIFRVERLGNVNYNENWRQGTVRISIRKFKNT